MSSLSQIARPYAKAVFQLAREQSTVSAWSDGLTQLAEQGRLPALPDIKHQFDALRADAERTVAVTVTTAESVDADRQGSFASVIAERLGREVKIDWATDDALIGGAIIRAEDLVIDGSIRGELERLQKQIGQ